MNEQTTTNTAAHDEPLAVLPPVDDDAAGREAVREKMADALTPGFQVEFECQGAPLSKGDVDILQRLGPEPAEFCRHRIRSTHANVQHVETPGRVRDRRVTSSRWHV